jgi:phage recombination protein Bet
LDPFSKQIYGIKRKVWDKDTNQSVERLTIQISVDGLRTLAQRTGEYQGQTMPQYCGDDGIWRDVWFGRDYPMAARVGVWRKGFREPLYGVALWSEFAQTKKDGKPTAMWESMPTTMLAKCAESQALRKAFPHETAGPEPEEPQPLPVSHAQAVLEDGTYQGTASHKRALVAAVREAGFADYATNQQALRELHGACLGCPLDELAAKVQEVLGDAMTVHGIEGDE